MRFALCLLGLLAGLAALPAQAARVVALAPHLAELVCAVDACDELVGVVSHSDYPASVAALPRVGNAHDVNAEALLALQPDLVLAWDGGTPVATVSRLRALGLRVEMIRVRSLEDVGMALLRVGALLGHEDAACIREKAFRTQLAALRDRYREAAPLRVMYQLEPEPVFTINADSPITQAMQVCGADNVFADYRVLAGPVSREAVIAADPDAIVFGAQDDVVGIRRGWQRFDGLRARRADNLIAVSADTLARATPRMVEGIVELCEALDGARQRLAELDGG